MPDTNRIIDTVSIQDNPSIIQSGDTTLDPFTIGERAAELNRYWGVVDIARYRRKFFPIEYWQLDKLIKRTGKVALVVKKINNPEKVNAKWVSYDPENPPVLDETSYCFVLSEPYYSGTIAILTLETESYFIYGLKKVDPAGAISSFLTAMLGKTAEGDYVVYFQNVTAQIIDVDPGDIFATSPGGEGASGIKLPRKPK